MSSIWTIRRSATDSKLTGLCGGIARHWGVDPVLIRVGAVLLALSGGIGLVLYLAGWLLIPVDGKDTPKIHDLVSEQARNWPREVWVAIVVIACVIVFTVFGSLTPFGFGPAVILALIWYFGYYKNRRSRPDSPTQALPPVQTNTPPPPQFFDYPGPATPFTEAADAWRLRIEEAQRSAGAPATYRGIYDQAPGQPTAYEDVREPVGPAESLPLARPLGAESMDYNAFLATPDPAGLYSESEPATLSTAASPVSRATSISAKRLRLVSLAALGLTLAGLGLADTNGVDIPAAAYCGAALLVLGLTLVAATWLGRARGILPVALLVLLATVGTSIGGPVMRQQGFDSVPVVYTTVPQLAAGNHLDRGALKVDLTGLTSTTNATYTASVDQGSLEVLAPKSMNVVVNWKVDVGGLVLDGDTSRFGTDESGTEAPRNPDPKKKTLTLDLTVDEGFVQVTR